jgi:hypothetical protein
VGNSTSRPFYWGAALLVCFTAGAFATDTLTLQNVNQSGVMGGVYTSPYTISVNGVSTLLICDDFLTNIGIGLTWQATETSLQSLQSSSSALKFPNPPDSNQIFNYATLAVLAAQLMALPNFKNDVAGEISYAIWGVFDPVLITTPYALSPGQEGYLTPSQLAAAQAYLSNAQAVVNQATTNGVINLSLLPSLTIYTPYPDVGVSQEFLRVSMPEPSLISILTVDLLAVAGLVFVFRQRMSRVSN